MKKLLVFVIAIVLALGMAGVFDAIAYDLPADIPFEPGIQYRIIQHNGMYVSPNVRVVRIPARTTRSRVKARSPWIIRSVEVYRTFGIGHGALEIRVFRKGES